VLSHGINPKAFVHELFVSQSKLPPLAFAFAFAFAMPLAMCKQQIDVSISSFTMDLIAIQSDLVK